MAFHETWHAFKLLHLMHKYKFMQYSKQSSTNADCFVSKYIILLAGWNEYFEKSGLQEKNNN